MRLGVNIDHVATLRQTRRGRYPDPVAAAVLAELGGADQITLHVREDRRHVNDRDLEILRKTVNGTLNLEMAAVQPMLDLALSHRPDTATLVPERRGADHRRRARRRLAQGRDQAGHPRAARRRRRGLALRRSRSRADQGQPPRRCAGRRAAHRPLLRGAHRSRQGEGACAHHRGGAVGGQARTAGRRRARARLLERAVHRAHRGDHRAEHRLLHHLPRGADRARAGGARHERTDPVSRLGSAGARP